LGFGAGGTGNGNRKPTRQKEGNMKERKERKQNSKIPTQNEFIKMTQKLGA
jgi:hypothetical protein